MATRRNDSTPEVHSARSKLDGVLQTLVDRRDESPDKDVHVTDSPDVLYPIKVETPDVSSPSKRNSRSAKKRKRGKDDLIQSVDVGHFHHTYVMKLFDRSVDLAQFSEDTPLFPVCRAWMRNEPHNRNLVPRRRSPTPEPTKLDDDDEDTSKDIYKLPRPVIIKREGTGQAVDLRIPSPAPQPDEHLDINQDPDKARAPELLLLDHMDRWKLVREKWKNQAQLNEARYADSLNILKDMFESHLKE